MDSNQGYNLYKWVICPLTRVINLHITSYIQYPEPDFFFASGIENVDDPQQQNDTKESWTLHKQNGSQQWSELKATKKMFLTPLKFNMEPENQPLEKEIPVGNHHFQVPC